MRIAVIGTGGVGGYFGARLAAAGQDVAFVARGRHLQALRAGGLRVLSPRGDVHLPEIELTDDPTEVGAADLVLIGVKLRDTESVVETIRPLVVGDTAVVSLQNGVVKDDLLRQQFGPEHVIGGVCYLAARIAEPGVIEHSGELQRLVVGEYDGQVSDRVARFRDACESAAIDVDVNDQIERAIWEKFVFLVGLSATTSTVGTPIGPIRSNPRSRAFLHDVMDEVVQVARAEGVSVPIDYAADRLAFVDRLAPGMNSSMAHDLQRGNPLEVAWLSGDVVERGTRLGVPTPCNRAVYDILSVHSDGGSDDRVAAVR